MFRGLQRRIPYFSSNPSIYRSSYLHCTYSTTFEWKKVDKSYKLSDIQQKKLNYYSNEFSKLIEEKKYNNIIYNQLEESIKQTNSFHSENIRKLYDFYSNHPNIKVIQEDWIASVTNNKYKGIGFKVGSSNKKRLWGGDDEIYKKNPILQQYLPRGCVMSIKKDNTPSSLILFGNKKFYGKSSGDDNDSNFISDSLYNDSYSNFIISHKANGECCQITICPEDSSVWIIGSKNKKIAVRSLYDISEYKNNKSYLLAVEMAQVFFSYLSHIGTIKENQLREFLQLTNLTMNFEFESPLHQHIVTISKQQLYLISCTGIHIPNGSIHPLLNYSIAKYFNMSSVINDLSLYPKSKLDNICNNIIKQWNSEGSVLILLDKDNNVIDYVKVKTWWYILLRCIREKLRRIKSTNTLNIISDVKKRINVLSNSMNINNLYRNCFLYHGPLFVKWIENYKKDKLNNLIDLYPILWNEYLTSNNLPNDNTLLIFNKDNHTVQNNNNSNNKGILRKNLPLLILFQGIPGIGKSYIAKNITSALSSKNIKTLDIAQDDFVKDYGYKNSGKECLKYIQNIIKKKEYKCIILARNNANIQQYQKYIELDTEQLCKVMFICPEELKTRKDDVLFLSLASILQRKKNTEEYHPTNSMDILSLTSLPFKFIGSLQVHPSAYLFPIMNNTNNNIFSNLITNDYKSILSRFKTKNFQAKDISQKEYEILNINNLYNMDIIQYRKDISTITHDIYNIISTIIDKDTPNFGSYIAISLNNNMQKILLNHIKSYFNNSCIPNNWIISCNHVTIMHSNSYYQSLSMIDNWHSTLDYINKSVIIKPRSILINNKLAVLNVSCYTKDNNKNIDNLIITKVPHITIATAPGIKPYESVTELKNTTNYINLATNIELEGNITLIE